MKQRGAAAIFTIGFSLLLIISVLFVFQERPQREWKDQIMLRMEVPYEKDHPTGKAAEYFARLVGEESGGELQIAVAYSTEPGSEKEIVKQLQFGGIAFSAVNYFDFAEDIPELNRFIQTYESPEEAQAGFGGQMDAIGEYLSKERLEVLSCYRPDYRCIATKEKPAAEKDFEGMKIHATKAAALSVYLLGMGAEIENFGRTDLLRAVDSGYIDGIEMQLLLYSRAGYDKVMPYVWVYEDFLVPDLLVASTVSLGNLTDEQQKLLLDCALKTETFQVEVMEEAQERQYQSWKNKDEAAEAGPERQVPR